MYLRICSRKICEIVVSVRLAIAASSSFSWGKRRVPIVAIKNTLLSQIHAEQDSIIVQRCPTILENESALVLWLSLRHWNADGSFCSWREKRALARFSQIYVILICGIICTVYIIYYYIPVRTVLCGGRIDIFVWRILILRCGFTAHSGFTRRIFLEVDSFLVFIGVRTLIRRTGSGVKIIRVCVSPDQIAVDLQLAHVLIECRAADSSIILCMLGR